MLNLKYVFHAEVLTLWAAQDVSFLKKRSMPLRKGNRPSIQLYCFTVRKTILSVALRRVLKTISNRGFVSIQNASILPDRFLRRYFSNGNTYRRDFHYGTSFSVFFLLF